MDENEVLEEEKKKNKDIEVITGNGKNLDISPVYNHVKIDKRDTQKNKNKKIIVPKSE